MTTRRSYLKLVGGASAIGLAGCSSQIGDGSNANGAEYPQNDLTLVVPYGEGGGTDTYARQIASPLSEEVDVNVVVENTTGAGGARGTGQVITDGEDHTILANNLSIMPSSILETRPPWGDQLTDIVPVYGYGYNANILVGHPSKAGDFETFLKQIQTDEISTVATVGPGSNGDMVMSALAEFDEYPVSEDDFEPVPYDSGAEVGRAVIQAEADVGLTADTPLAAAYDGDNFNPLVSFSSQGSPMFPNMPTVVDEGYENMDTLGQNTRCLWLPPEASTDKADTIANHVSEAVESDEVQSWADETGNPTAHIEREELQELLTQSMELLPTVLNEEPIEGWPQSGSGN